MHRLIRPVSLAAVLAASSLLTACVVAPAGYYPAPRYAYPQAPVARPAYPAYPAAGYVDHGHIANIEVMQSQTPGYGTSGGGAVLGGVLGGAVGNQFGRGNGRAAATALGVIGGAVLGNTIEAQNNAPRVYQSYRVSVQTDQGAYRVFDVPHPGDLRIGDRVRIDGNQISRD